MASKKDLIAQALVLTNALGLDVATTDDMSHDELTAIVKDLKAKAPEDEPDDEPVPAKKAKAYYVAKGKSVTSLKGIIDSEHEVTADLFSGGKESLTLLVEANCVVYE